MEDNLKRQWRGNGGPVEDFWRDLPPEVGDDGPGEGPRATGGVTWWPCEGPGWLKVATWVPGTGTVEISKIEGTPGDGAGNPEADLMVENCMLNTCYLLEGLSH